MARYLDPKADMVFKKIFGQHAHLLKSFLNALLPLPDDGLIVSLEYLTLEQVPTMDSSSRTPLWRFACRNAKLPTLP